MSMKNPLTLAEIEPATFRIVAQHLNHWLMAKKSLNPSQKINKYVEAIKIYVIQK